MSRSSTRCDAPHAWLAAALAATSSFVAGCGYAPGDYIVYRLGLSAEAASEGCYYPGEPPEPGQELTSSLNTSATWVLFFAAGDRVVLDIETSTLEGSESDDGYEFEGYTVSTSYSGTGDDESKTTVTGRDSVQMEVEGTRVQGSLSQLTHQECLPLSPTASAAQLCGDPVPDCVRTRQFDGVQLVDVTLESSVDGSTSPVPPQP